MNDSNSKRRVVPNWLLIAALAGPAIPCLFAFGARWSWLFELCTHFYVHYLAAFVCGAIICLLAKRFKLAAIFGAFAFYGAWFVAPFYFASGPTGVQGRAVRVMTVNAYCANQERDRLMRHVAGVSPDMLLVMEIDGDWAQRLESLADTYPHRLIEHRTQDCFGIALLSKLPVAQLEVRAIGQAGFPSVFARFEHDGQPWFHLIGTHPIPPMRRFGAALRNQQLDELGRLAGSLDGPVILLGDLNTTSWSPYFRDLLKASGLRDSRTGFGNHPSWRSDLIALGIAIDHVLVSPEIEVRNRTIGPHVGSDHRPVTSDLVIPTR